MKKTHILQMTLLNLMSMIIPSLFWLSILGVLLLTAYEVYLYSGFLTIVSILVKGLVLIELIRFATYLSIRALIDIRVSSLKSAMSGMISDMLSNMDHSDTSDLNPYNNTD